MPPYGSRFFHFDIQIFRNVAALGVGAPPDEVGTPLWEILDPLLYISIIYLCILSLFSIEFPASVYGISAVFHVIHHCTVVGTLYFCFLKIHVWPIHLYHQIISVCWVIWHFPSHMGWHICGWSAFIKECCPLASFSEARWQVERGSNCMLKIWFHLVWRNVSTAF